MAPSKTGKETDHKNRYGNKTPAEQCTADDDRGEDPKPPRRRRRVRFDPCGTPPATPYLVIRSFGEDLGVRPVPPEDAAVISFSPDIPLVPEVTPEGAIILQCWITNIGLGPAAPVQIEFFLMPPSITQPGPDPVLVATEHAIISPHMSELVKTRPLSIVNPFGGGLAQGVVVRCSTPFDRHVGTLDPVQDRHVAVMNAWPIIDQLPEVSLGLSNLTSGPETARVDVSIHKIRRRSASRGTPSVEARFAGQDVLEIGERPTDVARHLGATDGLKTRHRKAFRRVLKGLRSDPAETASILSATGANQLSIDAVVNDAPRKIFPTVDFIRRQSALAPAGGSDCDLPPGRRTLVGGIALGAFEERSLKLKITLMESLRDDEYFAVHLFHVDEAENAFRGRVCLVLGRTPPAS